MKLRLIILLAGCAFYTNHAQQSLQEYQYVPFPNSNAVWSEMYYPPILSGDDPRYERFALTNEDTLIGSIAYKKVYIFFDTAFIKENASYVGGIREDENKKIFYRGTEIHGFKPSYIQIVNNGGTKDDEILLFDFSLQVGDTFSYGNLSMSEDYLVVTEIDTLRINNSTRKIFHFEPIWWVQWIEGIGSLKGLLFTSGDLPTNGLDNDLICFKKNDTILYFNAEYDKCIPLITKTNEIIEISSVIRAFPNPAFSSVITFLFPDNSFEIIEIFDSRGILIQKQCLDSQTEFMLSTEVFKKGIYFYSAFSKGGKKYTGKFIINHSY